MIRILNAEPQGYCDEARAVLQQVGRVEDGPLSRAELLQRLHEFDILIVRLAHQIDAEVLERGLNLKAVISATTGLDHIDVDYAERKGIAVLSLQGEENFLRTVNATAEHTWGLLLALLRRIPQAFDSVKGGAWQRDSFRGQELAGKCFGIVGFGRLGRKVARYGQAFDMEVWAYDVERTQTLPGVTWAETLLHLLRRSNVVSVHVPLTAATKGLLGRPEFMALPPGAVLVNTSRGEVVDENALLEALQSGRLGGAALDVLSNERRQTDFTGHPLVLYARENDNLLLTPHIGGASVESMARTEVFMAQKLVEFLQCRIGVPAKVSDTSRIV